MFKSKKCINRAGLLKRRAKYDDSDYNDGETMIVKKEKKRFIINNKRQKNVLNNDDSSREEHSITVSYKSKRMGLRRMDQGATRILQIETENDRDAQAIFEKAKIINAVRPIRAPVNLRATVRWDYQPDICEDYKETGFCGFGDSCKYLHDRSNHKLGWQLKADTSDNEDVKKYEIDSNKTLSFKCLICRESFTDPVRTWCKHYFCEKCALQQHKKSARCYVCDVDTYGVFNQAKELIKRINQSKYHECDSHKEDESGDDD